MTKFTKETGVIIDIYGNILHLVEGRIGVVEFPVEVIWEIFKKQPQILILSHTHPPFMEKMSHEDITTLKAWAMAVYPFPFGMEVISKEDDQCFSASRNFCFLQSKEDWIKKGKEKPREFKIIEISCTLFESYPNNKSALTYRDILIRESYES